MTQLFDFKNLLKNVRNPEELTVEEKGGAARGKGVSQHLSGRLRHS